MDVTATEETRAHYQRPEVREIITRYAMPGDGADGAWRALNGDFSWWYHNEGNIQRLLNIDDYDQIINQVRTLYQSLNVFWQPLRFGWRDRPDDSWPSSALPLGTLRDTIAYSLGVDIDRVGGDIEEPAIKAAVEAAAQFLVDDLKKNGMVESIWAAFSGGGIYIHVHHGICRPAQDGPDVREEFFVLLTDRFNSYIQHIAEEFFKIHPEHAGKVKFDSLNNQKRVFKCILSVHKSKPFAVTPLDRDEIKIDFDRARLPLKQDMIEEARKWYQTYDPAEREPMLKLLDKFKDEEKEIRTRERLESGISEPGDMFRSPVKIEIEDFPPCIKHIIDAPNTGEGKTRFAGVLSAYLYQAGWGEDEAWDLVRTVSDLNGLGGAEHIFDSCFGAICCPVCRTIQEDAAGYPHLGLKGLGACKPDEKCDTSPCDYGIAFFMDEWCKRAQIERKNAAVHNGPIEVMHVMNGGDPDTITEQELEAYSLPDGPKFECRLPKNNFIQNFSEYGSDISDAYAEYWGAGALFALAVAADKKIKLVLRQGTIYPNLYISINGKSSLARKSTVVDKTEAMLCDVLLLLRPTLVPTEFSPEAFTEHLSDFNHAPWIRDEAAGVLGLMKKDYMRGFKDSLMQLYDCKPFYRKLRTSQRKNARADFRVDDPYLNLFWATTDASLGANTEQNDTLSGFMARFLFFFPQGQKTKWLPLEEGNAANSMFEGVVRDQLASIAVKMAELPECTALHFSPDAASYYTEWQRVREEEWTASNDGNAMQIYSRLAPTVVKLSMLFELGSPDFDVSNPIRLEFVEEACRLVDSYFMPTARAVYDLVGSNAEKNVIDRIIAYLKKHGGKASKKDIMRDIKIKSADFHDYLDTMRESGVVETKNVPRGGKGRDGIWVFLTDPSIVDNVAKVAKIAKVAKVEEIPSENEETEKSTLATLPTLPILPILATMGQDTTTGGEENPTPTAPAPAGKGDAPKLRCAKCGADLTGHANITKNGESFCALPGCGYPPRAKGEAGA